MSAPMGLVFEGLDGVERMIGIVASVFDEDAHRLVMNGMIRETDCPGLNVPVVDKPQTMEQHWIDQFETEGKSAYNAEPWTRYGNEPKYERYKLALDAGNKVGTWDGSAFPLEETLTWRESADHIERIEVTSTGARFEVGSARHYARDFSDGGRMQRWDGVLTPARTLRPVNTDKGNLAMAKGYQRVLVGRLYLDGAKNPGKSIPRITL